MVVEEDVINTFRVRVPRRGMLGGKDAAALRGSDDCRRVVPPPTRNRRRSKNA